MLGTMTVANKLSSNKLKDYLTPPNDHHKALCNTVPLVSVF